MPSWYCKGQGSTLLRAFFVVAVTALTVSCSNNGYFRREVERVEQRLQGLRVAGQSAEPERDGNSLRVSWDFQSERPPAGFLDWSASQLGQDYHVTRRTASTADFVKGDQGDSVYLTLKVRPSGSGSFVECVLQAMPD